MQDLDLFLVELAALAFISALGVLGSRWGGIRDLLFDLTRRRGSYGR